MSMRSFPDRRHITTITNSNTTIDTSIDTTTTTARASLPHLRRSSRSSGTLGHFPAAQAVAAEPVSFRQLRERRPHAAEMVDRGATVAAKQLPDTAAGAAEVLVRNVQQLLLFLVLLVPFSSSAAGPTERPPACSPTGSKTSPNSQNL